MKSTTNVQILNQSHCFDRHYLQLLLLINEVINRMTLIIQLSNSWRRWW